MVAALSTSWTASCPIAIPTQRTSNVGIPQFSVLSSFLLFICNHQFEQHLHAVHLPASSKFVRTMAIKWMNLGEVPGVMPKGLSVRCYTVSVRGSAFWSTRERQRRPNNSLGLSASVISMLDSLHLAKVVEGDLAWP